MYIGSLSNYYRRYNISSLGIFNCGWVCKGRLLFKNPSFFGNSSVQFFEEGSVGKKSVGKQRF